MRLRVREKFFVFRDVSRCCFLRELRAAGLTLTTTGRRGVFAGVVDFGSLMVHSPYAAHLFESRLITFHCIIISFSHTRICDSPYSASSHTRSR